MKKKNNAKFYWGVLRDNSIGVEYIPYKHEEFFEIGTPVLIPEEYVIYWKDQYGEELHGFSQPYIPVIISKEHFPVEIQAKDIYIEKHCPSKLIYDLVRHPVATGLILCILYIILLLSIFLPVVINVISPEQLIFVPLVAIACCAVSVVFGIRTMLKILEDNYTYTSGSYTLCLAWNRENLKSLKKFKKYEKFC